MVDTRTPGYLDEGVVPPGSDAVDFDDERLVMLIKLEVKKAEAGKDWAVAVPASKTDDSNNGSPLESFRFDDTIEEGVGFPRPVLIPTNTTKVTFHIVSRAETTPGGTRTVGVKVYSKGYPDNAAVESWSSGFQLADIDIPTNEFWQYDTDTRLFSALGLTAGRMYRFEWTRVAPLGGTDLTGDWTICEPGGITVRFH